MSNSSRGLADDMADFKKMSCDPNDSRLNYRNKCKTFQDYSEDHIRQKLSNDKDLVGLSKYYHETLNKAKQYECDFLREMKSKMLYKSTRTENMQIEELISDALSSRNAIIDKDIFKKYVVRTTEPELRELSVRMKQKLHGETLSEQIKCNKYKRLKDHMQELEYETNLLKADRIAEDESQKLQSEKKTQFKEQVKRNIEAQKIWKVEESEEEKRISKQIIDELVAAEKLQIADEVVEQQRRRNIQIEDYRMFIKEKAVRQAKAGADEHEFERDLLCYQQEAFLRREDEERRKRENLKERSRLQETVFSMLKGINEERERQRMAYLKANEEIAWAEGEVGLRETKERKKRAGDSEQMRKDLEYFRAIRKKAIRAEQETEGRHVEQMLEKIKIGATESELMKKKEKERISQEFREAYDNHLKFVEEEASRTKHEVEKEIYHQQQHLAAVHVERKAMIAEYKSHFGTLENADQSNVIGHSLVHDAEFFHACQ